MTNTPTSRKLYELLQTRGLTHNPLGYIDSYCWETRSEHAPFITTDHWVEHDPDKHYVTCLRCVSRTFVDWWC